MTSRVVVRVEVDRHAAEALLSGSEVGRFMATRARLIERRQRDLVPVDTGNLESHIRTKTDGNDRLVGVFGVDYVLPVEFGYEHAKSHRWVPAQPFIRPSVDAARG